VRGLAAGAAAAGARAGPSHHCGLSRDADGVGDRLPGGALLDAEVADGVGGDDVDELMEFEEALELLDVALADPAPVGADCAADEVAVGLGLDRGAPLTPATSRRPRRRPSRDVRITSA
jgi:hypothetical protein